MKDLSSELTVFVLSVERKENYAACIYALNKQTVSFKIEEIKDVCPMSTAMQKMLDNCTTKYFIQIDEDMVLNPDAIETMYNNILPTEENVGMICFGLFDCHLQYKVDGVKIYKHSIFKKFPYTNNLESEIKQLEKLNKSGYEYVMNPTIMGKHSPYWTPLSIFNRYKNLTDREKKWGNNNLGVWVRNLWNVLKENPTELNLFAFLGSLSSAMNKETPKSERDFRNSKSEEFTQLLSLLKFKTEPVSLIDGISTKKSIVQVARIPCANSGLELSNLINLYSKDFSSRYILFHEYGTIYPTIPYRKFPYDLFWEKNKSKCLEVLKKADIVHVHHDLFWDNEVLDAIKEKKVIVTWYNLTNSMTYSKSSGNVEFNKKLFKLTRYHTVVDQPLQRKMFDYISRVYVPLVKCLFNEDTRKNNPRPVICFAPTNKEEIGIGTKKYSGVLHVMDNLANRGLNFEFDLIEGVPYDENLIRKSRADIIIDDVDPMYEKFHNTSIEAACFGAVPITNYSSPQYPFNKTALGQLEDKLACLIINPDRLKAEQERIVSWRKVNYTPEKLLMIYEKLYKEVLK